MTGRPGRADAGRMLALLGWLRFVRMVRAAVRLRQEQVVERPEARAHASTVAPGRHGPVIVTSSARWLVMQAVRRGADVLGPPRRPPLQEQLAGTMFDVPDPPTGPVAVPSTGNSWPAYLRWRASPAGLRAWRLIEEAALALAADGAARISVNALVERVRATAYLEVNNTYRAWLADDLVRAHPALLTLIERRRRTKVA